MAASGTAAAGVEPQQTDVRRCEVAAAVTQRLVNFFPLPGTSPGQSLWVDTATYVLKIRPSPAAVMPASRSAWRLLSRSGPAQAASTCSQATPSGR
ncbi:MAG: hypothetical protein Ct9H300mP16_09510 [Pseudomonadota bacterium]|nr:MAG: hypothetical protein Ct9H300mP16_09510 [Pseudomonadota bacterium]